MIISKQQYENLRESDDGEILIGESEIRSFNEDTKDQEAAPRILAFNIVTDQKELNDFKKFVIEFIDKAEKLTGNKLGEGPGDAVLNHFAKFFSNAHDKVEKKDGRMGYALIYPTKLMASLGIVGFSNPKKYVELGESIFKNAGMKKGRSAAGGEVAYFYKIVKDNAYVGWIQGCSAMVLGPVGIGSNQMQIYLKCVKADDKFKQEVLGRMSVKEYAELDDEIAKFYGKSEDTGIAASLVGMIDDEKNFYKDPVYNKAVTEYFDLSDRTTCRTLTRLNEAGQNTILANLTSKLYDNIVAKCDDIDYGEIPATKGDITKLSNYNKLKECIILMHGILDEYKQDTGPIDELSLALANVESRKDLFERAYRYNTELPIAMYCNIVMGIITGISYMIATCIEFIKEPNDESFKIVFDRMAYSKNKDHLVYTTLARFNKSCAHNEFDKAMEAVIKAGTKNFAGAAIAGGIAIGILGLILILIPILKELVFMFFYMKMRVSDFFDIQADLLQMNAYNLEANESMQAEKRKTIVKKQLKFVEHFRKVSNSFAIKTKEAEVKAGKEDRENSKKMKIGDIDTGSTSTSALF